jgi:hypothetical protein
MIHHLILLVACLLAIPSGVFLLAFLAAFVDYAFAFLFPTPIPHYPDDIL